MKSFSPSVLYFAVAPARKMLVAATNFICSLESVRTSYGQYGRTYFSSVGKLNSQQGFIRCLIEYVVSHCEPC